MIYFRDDAAAADVDGRALVATARALLNAVGESKASLSLSLVSDDAIRELNRAHRGVDAPTDVLSFSIDGEGPRPAPPGERPERLLGDVVISVDTARRQAAGYDATLQNELYRLLIHGILHAVGHDHHERAERAVMEGEERRLADAIALPWPYETPR